MQLREIIHNYRLKNNVPMVEFAKLSGIGKPYVSVLGANKNFRDGKKLTV